LKLYEVTGIFMVYSNRMDYLIVAGYSPNIGIYELG
jgi:hypothetical protein